MIEIKSRFENKVLFTSVKATTMKAAIVEAVKKKTNLSGADLSRADLTGANLLFCMMDKKVFEQITKKWFEWKIKE